MRGGERRGEEGRGGESERMSACQVYTVKRL